MPDIITDTSRVINALMVDNAVRRATVFRSPSRIVKATRQRRFDSRDGSRTILVTYGKPNLEERKFIGSCKRAGEPFPVKKVQLKAWPAKKKSA